MFWHEGEKYRRCLQSTCHHTEVEVGVGGHDVASGKRDADRCSNVCPPVCGSLPPWLAGTATLLAVTNHILLHKYHKSNYVKYLTPHSHPPLSIGRVAMTPIPPNQPPTMQSCVPIHTWGSPKPPNDHNMIIMTLIVAQPNWIKSLHSPSVSETDEVFQWEVKYLRNL